MGEWGKDARSSASMVSRREEGASSLSAVVRALRRGMEGDGAWTRKSSPSIHLPLLPYLGPDKLRWRHPRAKMYFNTLCLPAARQPDLRLFSSLLALSRSLLLSSSSSSLLIALNAACWLAFFPFSSLRTAHSVPHRQLFSYSDVKHPHDAAALLKAFCRPSCISVLSSTALHGWRLLLLAVTQRKSLLLGGFVGRGRYCMPLRNAH